MSELPQYQPDKPWQAEPEAFDELAQIRDKREADRLAAEETKRTELRKIADEKYPTQAEANEQNSPEQGEQSEAA